MEYFNICLCNPSVHCSSSSLVFHTLRSSMILVSPFLHNTVIQPFQFALPSAYFRRSFPQFPLKVLLPFGHFPSPLSIVYTALPLSRYRRYLEAGSFDGAIDTLGRSYEGITLRIERKRKASSVARKS